MQMKIHQKRPRSKYHNKKSYDDELDIVLSLLNSTKKIEKELKEQYLYYLTELCKLYKQEFPFYYKNNVLNKKKYSELAVSLTSGKNLNSKLNTLLNQMKEDTQRLQVSRTTAWLILDYQLSAQGAAKSLGVKWQPQPKVVLEAKVKKPWCKDHRAFVQRIYDNCTDLDKKLRKVILDGVRYNQPIEETIEEFRDLTGFADYKIARLIRTETMAAYSLATKDVFLENGIEYVEIIGDAACGGICTEFVGNEIPLQEAVIGDELPPYHPNCACSFCAYDVFDEKTGQK